VKARETTAIFVGAGLFLALLTASSIVPLALYQVGSASPGFVLWTARTGEVLLQGLIILGGVFSILFLLGPRTQGGGGP